MEAEAAYWKRKFKKVSKGGVATRELVVQLEKDRRNVQIVAAVVLNAVQRWTRESGSNDTGPAGEVPAAWMCQCGAGRHAGRGGKFFFVFLYYEIPSGQELVELTGQLVARARQVRGDDIENILLFGPLSQSSTSPPHLQPTRVSLLVHVFPSLRYHKSFLLRAMEKAGMRCD